jgi:hypothetical protein
MTIACAGVRAQCRQPGGRRLETRNITVTSPLGETTALLRFEINGADLSGELTGKGGSGPIAAQLWPCRVIGAAENLNQPWHVAKTH